MFEIEKGLRFLALLGAVAVLCALVGFLLWDIRTGESLRPVPEARQVEPLEETVALVPPAQIAEETEPPQTRDSDPVQDDLSGPGTIRGKVVRGNVAPERNAEVLLYYIAPNDLSLSTPGKPFKRTSCVDGSFAFDALPLGFYTLIASSSNYCGTASADLGKNFFDDTANISVYRRATISGTVMDASGDGIPDAEVFLSAYYSMGGKGTPMPMEALASLVFADRDGKYEIGALLKPDDEYAEYEITTKASGYAAKTMPYVHAGTRNWDVVLSRGGSASGQVVVSGTEEPLPHVTVRVVSETVLDGVEVTTDEAGTFYFPSLPPGQHRAQVFHGDMVAEERSATFTVGENLKTEGLRIEMTEGGVLSGRLFDADTGVGIGGETIRSGPLAFYSAFQKSRETDENGYYEFRGLAAGTYWIFRPDVYGYPGTDHTDAPSTKYAEVKLGEVTRAIDFPLSQGLVLDGRIIDKEGNPIADAHVDAMDESLSIDNSARTRPSGEFVFAGLLPRTEYTLYVEKEGYGVPPSGPYIVPPEGLRGIEIVMERAEGRIEGFVVNSRSRPVPNVLVSVQAEEHDFVGRSLLTDEQGRFSVKNLLHGDYQFAVSQPDYSWHEIMEDTPSVRVRSGVTVKGIRLVYEIPKGQSISGRITNTQGGPVEWASVDAWGPTSSCTVTGPDGRYELVGLSEGHHALYVRDARHSPKYAFEIPAGSTDVDFVLNGFGTIEGQILDAISRDPIIEFGVSLTDETGQTSEFQNFHDVVGKFTLPDVPEGEVIVTAIARGYAQSTQAVSGVRAGATVKDIVLYLDSGASVEGVITNVQGEPVANVHVYESDSEFPKREYGSTAMTAFDGTYTLLSLPEGPAKITATHGSYASAFEQVDLDSNTVVHLDIVLGQGATVQGIVTRTGAPVAGVYVALVTSDDYNSTQTDKNGYYEFLRLAEESATLSATFSEEPDGVWRTRERSQVIAILENQVIVANFDFPRNRAALEGTVYTELSGVWQADLTITLHEDGTPHEIFFVRTDSQGRYLFESLPTGQLILSVDVEGMPSRAIPLDLAADTVTSYDVDMLGGTTISVTAANFPPSAKQAVFAALYGEHDIPSQMDSQYRRSLRRFEAASTVTETSSGLLQGLEPGIYTIIVGAIPATLDIADVELLPETTFASTIVEIVEGQADTEIVVEF